eukprot:CAMPEP_0201281146 /NCGR_PEP_ID=MMETSP1317-20130820/1663_1 /ASSEMBLY_ACC=CAM_ASM_000770 /TAXON_ID=187299 /ORGANISM="Undescribed Undescribed, Strain Undescribed" /LENGTH=183 /DNA_ID=CAMNT_0047590269 /DNA_START=585 /DNA_END=1136 /DNA_ORIENTATION=-
MDLHNVSIEEREEYEMHIRNGVVVYAGVDYQAILARALDQDKPDIIIWDGGNNDFPFYQTDFWITVADPLRAGHEIEYYPGNTNFRACDVIVINKCNHEEAKFEGIVANAAQLNPSAKVIKTNSQLFCDEDTNLIAGKRVLTIDDGPTLTHGNMKFGAGSVAAKQWGAAQVVNPQPYAVGSLI